MDLRNRMLSLHENKRLVGTVVEVIENIVAVRVGRRLITGLPVVGQSVVPGQLVYVDYTTGEPAVYAWYQRGVASTAATVTRSVNRRIISDSLVGVTAAPSAHTHDERYYTEGEVDTALAGKSDTGHTHTESEITDLDHTDAAALHEDVAGEIHALAEKTSPAAADELVIEDSADGYAKKRVQISNLPTGSGGATSFTDLDDVPASYTGLGGQYLRVKSSEDGLETGSPAGSGDMTKAVYDQDDDGKVDAAEAADSVPWTGVTGKPTAFPAEAHSHDDRYSPLGHTHDITPDLFYEHVQGVAADQWTVTHNLGKYPCVTVVDSAGTIVVCEVAYLDANTVRLTFTGAFAGRAYLN